MTVSKMSTKSQDSQGLPASIEGGHVRTWKSVVLTAVVVSVLTAVLVSAVFVAVMFSTRKNTLDQTASQNENWIHWTRNAGGTELRESVFVNEALQTIAFISAEAYRLNHQNSIALHDFHKGYVAMREFENKICFITNIPHSNFTVVKKMAEDREGKTLPLPPTMNAHARSTNMTSSELGSKLSEFCDGIHARWMDITEGKDMVKRGDVDVHVHIHHFDGHLHVHW